MVCKLNGTEVSFPCSRNCHLFGDCVVEFEKQNKKPITQFDRLDIECRCKDCKHWTKDYGGYCQMHGLDCYGNSHFGENSFCSLGERKDKAK